MFLVVGLGNPGEKYENTRHNVGFLALDTLAKDHEFPKFALSKKHSSLISEGVLGQKKTILAKPQTFMNNSGAAAKSLYAKYKIQDTKYMIVIHDDIDIPLGKVKISANRGSAGHKGVESIIQALGTKNFTRVRIGIQPTKGKPKDIETFVLKKFARVELPTLQRIIADSTETLTLLLAGTPEKAQEK